MRLNSFLPFFFLPLLQQVLIGTCSVPSTVLDTVNVSSHLSPSEERGTDKDGAGRASSGFAESM